MKPIQLLNREVVDILEGRKTEHRMMATDINPGDMLYAQEPHLAPGHWQKNGTYQNGTQRYSFIRDTMEDVSFEDVLSHGVYRTKREPNLKGLYRRQARSLYPDEARLFMRVTSVTQCELHSVTYKDIEAEGHKSLYLFRSMWESKYGRKAWASNPMIFVIKFDKL